VNLSIYKIKYIGRLKTQSHERLKKSKNIFFTVLTQIKLS